MDSFIPVLLIVILAGGLSFVWILGQCVGWLLAFRFTCAYRRAGWEIGWQELLSSKAEGVLIVDKTEISHRPIALWWLPVDLPGAEDDDIVIRWIKGEAYLVTGAPRLPNAAAERGCSFHGYTLFDLGLRRLGEIETHVSEATKWDRQEWVEKRDRSDY